MILIICSSLNPNSFSRKVAEFARNDLEQKGHTLDWLDLRDYNLPFCDGDSCYDHPQVKEIKAKIQSARVILCATPVYNYDVNAALKNVVELTGKAWEGKTVGLICTSGGKGSYMSPMPFLNSLMLDFRCRIIPRYVHAVNSSFTDDVNIDEDFLIRIKGLAAELIKAVEGTES